MNKRKLSEESTHLGSTKFLAYLSFRRCKLNALLDSWLIYACADARTLKYIQVYGTVRCCDGILK